MKKSIIVALALTLSATYSFANTNTNSNPNDNGNKTITTSFRNDFQNAQLLSTEEYNSFTKLTFRMNGVVMSAYYSGAGQLLAETRNILSSQLPVNLLLNIKRHYTSYWISDLFEFNSDTQNNYYITLENADNKITLRSNGDEWESYSSTKK